jgi:hypothetical protein
VIFALAVRIQVLKSPNISHLSLHHLYILPHTNLISRQTSRPSNMVTSANLASAQPDSNRHPRCLRRKSAFSGLLASNIGPPDPVPSVTGAVNATTDTMRWSNRKAVIINNVLCPPGLINNMEMSSTVASTGKSNFKVGGRKLRKKSLLHLPKEALKPGRGIPLPLPSDHLNVGEASREATLLRMSTLSASRLPAGHMQSGKASTTVQGPAARSADICDALSSHPVVVPEAVTTTTGPDISTVDPGNISTAVEQADPPQRERRARPQKRVRFEPNLESVGEKRERLDIGQVDPPPRAKVGCTQNRRIRFEENLESTGENRERLNWERDNALEKCEALERILDSIYWDRDSLKRELESITETRESLENKVVDLRKRIRDLETEAAAQHVKLDDEIGRGRLREAENRQLRDENQRLHADRHLQLCPEASSAEGVLAHNLLQKEDPGHTLYDITDVFGATHFRFQNQVETSRPRFHDPQITSRPAAASLIHCSSSNVPPSSVLPQAEPNNPEIVFARHQSMLQDDVNVDELGAMASNETLQQQTNSIGIGLVTDQLPEFLPTSILSSLPRDNDAMFCELSISNRPTEKGAGLGSPCLISQVPPQRLPELDSDTGSEDEDIESDQSNTDTLFRFGSLKMQAVPAIHRLRISTEETDQRDDETCLMPRLDTWEWSSIPDLQLWHPNHRTERNDDLRGDVKSI